MPHPDDEAFFNTMDEEELGSDAMLFVDVFLGMMQLHGATRHAIVAVAMIMYSKMIDDVPLEKRIVLTDDLFRLMKEKWAREEQAQGREASHGH